MITLDDHDVPALDLLNETPSGLAITTSMKANCVAVAYEDTDKFIGKCVSAKLMMIGKPFRLCAKHHQASVLAHELTHCMDMNYWNITMETLNIEQLGITEINAHFNQGLVLREICDKELIPGDEVKALSGSTFTFGECYKRSTRKEIFKFVRTVKHYEAAMQAIATLDGIWSDKKWAGTGVNFHCVEHFNKPAANA